MQTRGALLLALAVLGVTARGERTPEPVREPDLPAVLSLPAAEALFRERGFDLLLADSTVESAQGDLLAAGAVANPGISGSFGKSFACDPGQPCRGLNPSQFGGGLSDNFALSDTFSGKRGLRRDVARAALAAARLGKEDAERTLLAQLKQQFLQVLLSQESVKYALEAQESGQKLLGLTQTRYRAGAISEADLARVQTDTLEADQLVDVSRQNLRTAQVGLTFLLGFRRSAPAFEVTGADYLHFAERRALASTAPRALVEEALANRPDLKALGAQNDRAEAAVRLAHRLRVPDVGLSANYTQQGLSTSSIQPPTFSVGLSSTLPIFYQQRGEITKAEADLRTQRISAQKAEAQIVSDVESAWASFVASRQLAERMEGSLLERSRRARDLVALQYHKGAASLLELLDAQRTYRGVVLEYLQDITNYWTSVFRLEQAVGVELK